MVSIAPRPYQNPHPPLYAGFTHNTESIRYWGREGGKPIIIILHEELCGRLQGIYREEAEKAGRTVKPGTELALGGQLVVTESPSEAQQIVADTRWFWEKWGIPFGLGVAEPLIGDPDRVSRKIELAQKIGTDEMFFLLGDGLLPRDTILRSFELVHKLPSPAAEGGGGDDAGGVATEAHAHRERLLAMGSGRAKERIEVECDTRKVAEILE